jgi:hypothetical protein
MINWKELFEQERTVFHCETKEIAIEFLKIPHELGYSWNNVEFYLNNEKWNTYKEKTCYNIRGGMRGNTDYYFEKNFTVYNVKELLVSNKSEPKLLKRR